MKSNKRLMWLIGVTLILASLLLASCRQASPPPSPQISEVGQRLVKHGQETQTYGRYLEYLGKEQGRASLEIEAARWLEMGQSIVKAGEQLIDFAPLLNIPSRGTQPHKSPKLELDDLWADGMLLKTYGDRIIKEQRNMKVDLLKQLTQGEIEDERLKQLIQDCNFLEEAGQLMVSTGQFMQDYVKDVQRSIGAPPYGTTR